MNYKAKAYWLSGCGIEPYASLAQEAGAAQRIIDALAALVALAPEYGDPELIPAAQAWKDRTVARLYEAAQNDEYVTQP